MKTKAYACYSLDDEERKNSSSGGVYPLLAREIIRNGGVVFAACYDNNLNVVHKMIDHEDGIRASQGSKYVQSSLTTTFQDIITHLKNGIKVLFVGTPCQCAGLLSLVNVSKTPRSDLFVVDFVCHGVPGKAAWNAYKKSRNANGSRLVSVNMRDKTTGWSDGNYAWREVLEHGDIVVTPRRQNLYLKGMLANLYLRPSCYSCSFKGIARNTDITVGDYWGVWNHIPEMDDNKGTSLVLVHTEQGVRLFSEIKDTLKIANADVEKAVAGNTCIINATKYNQKREEFFRRLNNGEDFSIIVADLTKITFTSRLKNKVNNLLKLHCT